MCGPEKKSTYRLRRNADHINRGIDQAKTCTTATVTGSLLQKPVTVAADNQGSLLQTKQAPSSKKTEATRKKVGSIREEMVKKRPGYR
jgi:hypothetical protein